MYLRRFAEPRYVKGKHKGHYLTAVPVARPDCPFSSEVGGIAVETGFHWYTNEDGARHAEVERLMTRIEGRATGAFQAMLDTQHALPERWPLRPELRRAVAVWMSAQYLRTVQKRSWLENIQSPRGDATVFDAKLAKASKANRHLEYLVSHLFALATVLYARPWCLGATSVCLPTGDSPMVSFDVNHREAIYDQVTRFDLALPLDSHRFLLLPSDQLLAEDPRKREDHFVADSSVLGHVIGHLVFDWSHRHVFHHPAHFPFATSLQPASWMPNRRDSADGGGPQALLGGYAVLPHGYTVPREVLTTHTVKAGTLRESETVDEYLRSQHAENLTKAASQIWRMP